MPEENTHNNKQESKGNENRSFWSKMPIVPLLVAGAAIIIIGSYYAFRDTSEQNTVENNEIQQLPEGTQEELDEARATINYAALQVELEARLLALRNAISANVITDTLVDDLRNIRTSMSSLSANANVAVQAEINELVPEIEKLETQVQENPQEALTTIENVLNMVRQSIESQN